MSHLALHFHRQLASRAVVAEVPSPAETETYMPVPHLTVVRQVEQALNLLGMEVVDEAFGLWGRRGERFMGLLELASQGSEDDYGIVVGVFNSHDKSRPAGAALGSRVYGSNHLAFSGEVTFARKHTPRVLQDLPGIVDQSIARLVDARGRQAERIAQYKAATITDATAHDALIRTIDARALPVPRLSRALVAWRKPSFMAFYPRTVWSLFNAVSGVVSGESGSLAELPRRTLALHAIMDQVSGLVAPAL